MHGQIYDYMLRLQSYYGLRNVFGIVTTYEQWRFYWFPSCDEVAAGEEIDERLHMKEPKEEEDEEDEEELESQQIENSEEIS